MELLRYTYKQTNDWTCGPAIARVILHYFGVKPSISDLIKQLRTTRAGTENRYIISLFKRNNIKFFHKKNSSISEIRRYLKNYWIIVAYWIPVHNEAHYSIIKKMNSKRIYFHDTWFGLNHSYTLNYFLKNWHDDETARWFMAVKK